MEMLAQKDGTKVTELENRLKDMTEEFDHKDKRIAELEKTVASLKQDVYCKDRDVTVLTQKLEECSNLNKRLEKELVGEPARRFSELEEKLFASNERFNELIARIEGKDKNVPKKTILTLVCPSPAEELKSTRSKKVLTSRRRKN